MNLNNVQIKMMQDIENEVVKLPSTHSELHSLISSIMLAVDTEAIEKPFLDKCRSQIARTYFAYSNGKAGEGVYLSRIKNQLVRRAYFRTFEIMCNGRNADAFKVAYRSLITDGYLKSDGLHMSMTEDAKTLL